MSLLWIKIPKSQPKICGLTQNSKPVVDCDDDDVPIAGQDATIDHVACSLHVGTTMDVDHDWL